MLQMPHVPRVPQGVGGSSGRSWLPRGAGGNLGLIHGVSVPVCRTPSTYTPPIVPRTRQEGLGMQGANHAGTVF